MFSGEERKKKARKDGLMSRRKFGRNRRKIKVENDNKKKGRNPRPFLSSSFVSWCSYIQ
jgi:hypothetical protein